MSFDGAPIRWGCLAMLAWALALTWCLSSCASLPRPALSPDDARAVHAFVSAWEGAGLPSLAACDIDRTDVLHTITAEQFSRWCNVPASYAAACTAQRKTQRGLIVYATPLAVLRPGQPSIDSVGGGPVVHELIHWASGCTGGALDAGHADPRYWEVASRDPAVRAASVQGRARMLLSAPRTP